MQSLYTVFKKQQNEINSVCTLREKNIYFRIRDKACWHSCKALYLFLFMGDCLKYKLGHQLSRISSFMEYMRPSKSIQE